MNKLDEISVVLSSQSEANLIQSFLSSLLTPKEIHDISTRWELVKRLVQGQSQRSIAQDLGLSLCKITRGSKELKKEDSSIKKVIEQFNQIGQNNG
jgi:TrpR family trp operon transcriptional repressor